MTPEELQDRLQSLYKHLSDEGWHVHANTVAIAIELIKAGITPSEEMLKAGGRHVADIIGDPYANSHWMHFSNEAVRIYKSMFVAAVQGDKVND